MNSTSKVSKSKEVDNRQNTTSFNPKLTEPTQPTILQVECNKEAITAHLSDSRVITIPTGWYKVLREANAKQLKNVRIMPAKKGIYWPDLEEFLSIKAFTQGLNAGC